MTAAIKLLLVGCGMMGGALLQGIQAAHSASRIAVVNRSPPPPHIKLGPGLIWVAKPSDLDPFLKPDAVIIAVTPQQLGAALPNYRVFADSLFISVAAGITLDRLQALLQNDRAPIIRAMPNMPSRIGEGITVAVANGNVRPDQCLLADTLLQTIGETAWIEDEGLIDAVTALSGSGPAYVFALCEAMAEAGIQLGLPAGLAHKLARRTVAGSGALLAQSGQEAASLCRAVTLAGGTTEAALRRLLAAENGLHQLLREAMMAAASRAAELAKLA